MTTPAQTNTFLWIMAAALFAGALLYIGHGIHAPWVRGEAIDLELRSSEFNSFTEGTYPDRRVAKYLNRTYEGKTSVYPPYAFPLFAAFFLPETKEAERAWFQILSVLSLLFLAAYGAKQLAFAGRSAAALGAALPLAFSGNYVALYQGQFSIVCTALVMGQLWLLRHNRPVLAGLVWALAMLKPQIAIAFALLFLLRRDYWRGLVVGSVALVALSAFGLWWTQTPPDAFWQQGVASQGMKFAERTNYAAAVWIETFNIPPRQAMLAGLALLGGAGLALLTTRLGQGLSLENGAALAAVLGLSLFYHVHYDNMMLFPLLLALVTAALSQGSIRLALAAASVALIAYPEPGLVMGLAAQSAAARWTIFLVPILALIVLLAGSRRTKSADARQ